MSRNCEITGRKALAGNKRSHAMKASHRKFELNLQTVTIKNSKGKDITLTGSRKGIRTAKKKIAAAKAKAA